jgi:hypothetical protein
MRFVRVTVWAVICTFFGLASCSNGSNTVATDNGGEGGADIQHDGAQGADSDWSDLSATDVFSEDATDDGWTQDLFHDLLLDLSPDLPPEIETLDLVPESETTEPLCEPESCNGIDDDCDGDVDEPDFVGGDYVNLCNDDNECTQDICGGEEGCSYVNFDGGECKDGDACTVGDHCLAGACEGSPILCDDENLCTDDSCDGTGGCVFEINAAICDDSNPCTVKDTCEEGICTGFEISCECHSDEDCSALEDGDLCNGTLACDTDGLPFECVVDPESVVLCPEPPPGPSAICLKAACDSATGTCALAADHEGFACEDGDACTVGDQCLEGSCTPGMALPCADDNPCTDDSCDPDSGCLFEPNSSTCSDGSVCTLGDICNDTTCLPGEEPLACDDDNPCTTDSCDPDIGCLHTPNQDSCDDGNPCSLGDHCSNSLCLYDEIKVCDDSNLCTDDSCGPDGECLFALNSAPCDDADLCTTGDQCKLGACEPTDALPCDDGNLCTDDSCNPLTGCTYDFNDSQCSDDNVCTVGDHCAEGWCAAGSVQDCDDGSPCTKDSCDATDGCQYEAFSGPCSNGNPCSLGDTCTNGICFPGNLTLDCDDGNLCTDDHCEAWVGCVNTNNTLPCDDGLQCTVGDKCTAGACVPGQQEAVCNDDNGCTDDSCDDVKGCLYVPNSETCDDGNPCTVNDYCSNGACHFGGDPLNCDDDNDCTVDGCQSAIGCTHGQAQDGLPCSGEEGWACKTGVCTSPNQETKLVFVTSIGFNGNLGGVLGADAKCVARATAAGLEGTFKAWISAAEISSSPSVRFAKSEVPYALMDGTIIAANWADLTDGELQAPISQTELSGSPNYGPSVWSFTRVNATPGLFDNPNHVCYGTNCHCNGWTSTQTQGYNKPGSAVGQWAKPNDDWTDYSFANACASKRGLYCFQQ